MAMTTEEALDIIKNVIQVHWPAWNFEEAELEIWAKELRKYDHAKAKSVIGDLYMGWDKPYRPTAGKLKSVLASTVDRSNIIVNEPRLLYEIIPQEETRGYSFYTTELLDEQEIEKRALITCKNMNIKYRKKHYIKFASQEVKVGNNEPKLYGQPAFEKFVVDTLNGEDCRRKEDLKKCIELNNNEIPKWTKFMTFLITGVFKKDESTNTNN